MAVVIQIDLSRADYIGIGKKWFTLENAANYLGVPPKYLKRAKNKYIGDIDKFITFIDDLHWKLDNNITNHTCKVYKRDGKRYVQQSILELISISKSQASLRLLKWERGEITEEQLLCVDKWKNSNSSEAWGKLNNRDRSHKLNDIQSPTSIEYELWSDI